MRRILAAPFGRHFWKRLALILKGVRQLAIEVALILLVVSAIFLVVREVRTPSVRIAVASVPDDLKVNGFTEAAATELIRSELEVIQRVSETSLSRILPWREDQATQFSIPGAGFGIGDLAREIKRLLGISDTSITIYITRMNGQLGLTLRSSKSELRADSKWHPAKDQIDLVHLAAEQIARATQPYQIASYYYARHRLDDCRRIITEIQIAYPTGTKMRARAYNLAGRLLSDEGNGAAALVQFELARDEDPDSAYVYMDIGDELSRQEKYEDAITAYRKVVELDPEDAAALMTLSNVLLDADRADESKAAYDKAMKIETDDAAILHNLSIALGQRRAWPEAIEVSRRAIDIDSQTAAITNGLGYALLNSGQLDEATTAFERTLQIDPEFAYAWVNLCIIRADKAEVEEAKKACGKAIELAPEDSRIKAVVDAQLERIKTPPADQAPTTSDRASPDPWLE